MLCLMASTRETLIAMSDALALIDGLDRDGRVGLALSGVVEATTAAGRLWCPPEVGAQLINAIALRDTSMVAAMQGAVRLARLLEQASDGGLIAALYDHNGSRNGLSQLNRGAFRRLIEDAIARSRLPSTAFAVERTHVVCLEAELATRMGGAHKPALLPFAHMPLQGALLALLNEALGFPAVARHLDGLLRQGPPTSPAYAVANALLREFDEWLTANLNTAHHVRQVRSMRAYLNSTNRFRPEEIDDDAILGFWENQIERSYHNLDNGFQLFKVAARKMIALRDMARRANDAGAERTAEGFYEDAPFSSGGPHAVPMDATSTDADWQSPLAALLRPPANEVRWLMRTEVAELANFLGEPGSRDDTDSDDSGIAEPPVPRAPRGLSAGGRYDLSLWLTLLRADVFGRLQSRLVQRSREGAAPDDAIRSLFAECPDEPYLVQADRYRELRDLLHAELLIGLDGLARARDSSVLHLVGHTGSPNVERHLQSIARESMALGDGVRDDGGFDEDLLVPGSAAIVAALHDATCRAGLSHPGPLIELMTEARRAGARVRRKGLRLPLDPTTLAAFAAAAPALPVIVGELDRLGSALQTKLAKGIGRGDRDFFFRMFQRLHTAQQFADS